jgi:coenzyme F420 hydrogenase subunit beta
VLGPLREAPADPAWDVRDALAAEAGIVEPADKIWFHKTAAAVIDADRCVGCAGCLAACPSGSIGIAEDGRPTLVRMCTGCSRCWDFCPLAGLRSERLAQLASENGRLHRQELGPLRAAFYARAKEPIPQAQDGGVVTALLRRLLELGAIDGAVVSRRLTAFHGESILARSPEELAATAGSVYHQSFPLALLAQPLPEGMRRLALVATPCQVSVLRALQRFPWPYQSSALPAVTLTLALFCTRSFEPDRLRQALTERRIDPRRVQRVDVRDGRVAVVMADGEQVEVGPASDLATAGLPGCDECADFGGYLADLSLGNCGSPPGFTTVLVRSEAGEEAWRVAADALDWQPLTDLEPVARAERRNRRRALRHLRRRYDPQGSLWVSYSEHLRAYAGSERAPAPPPAHRSHHYRISC